MAKSKGRSKAKPAKKAAPTKKAAPKKKPATKKPTKKAAPPAPKKKRPTKIALARKRQRELDARDAAEEAARAKVLRGRTRDAQASRLITALELAQQMAEEIGHVSTLKVAFPPRTHEGSWRAPWAVVGRFVFKADTVGYAELHEILERWGSSRLTKKINGERLARIRVEYGEDKDGDRLEHTISETFPWSYMLARAMLQCDPSDTDSTFPGGAHGSLAARYADTKLKSIFVWLSTGIGVEAMKPAPAKTKKRTK